MSPREKALRQPDFVQRMHKLAQTHGPFRVFMARVLNPLFPAREWTPHPRGGTA
jgi:hypothetical protein